MVISKNQSEVFLCGICNASNTLDNVLVIENIPSGAQKFDINKKKAKGNSCTFKAITCSSCQTTQSIINPISNYSHVHRSSSISQQLQEYRLEQMRAFISKYKLNGKKIIEIGCGNGENIQLFHELDALFFGIEAKDIRTNKTVINAKIEKAFLEDAIILKRSPFDAFFSFNVLEHWPRFRSIFKHLKQNLTSNSVGIIEVPNYEMIQKNHLYNEFIPDHIYYFTPYSLETALRVNGFKVIDLNIIQNNYIISATVKRSEPESFYGYQKRLKKLEAQFTDIFHTSNIKKIAIWGAGHQALATISTLQIQNKVEFIVDSSPMKQNQYSPASGLKIFSPTKLKENNTDTVLVICGSFDLEVIKLIKAEYKSVRNIFQICDGELKRHE